MSKKVEPIKTIAQLEKEVEKKFNTLTYSRNRLNVWQDMMSLFAITVFNQLTPQNYEIERKKELEEKYLSTIKAYNEVETKTLSEILGLLTLASTLSLPYDLLGKLYMKLEVSNDSLGQFFTPDSISKMMAKLVGGETNNGIAQKIKETKVDITINDPSCGSSSTLLAPISENFEDKDRIVLHGNDIDLTAVHMSYIHMYIWEVRAILHHANTLTMECYSTWVSPRYFQVPVTE